MTNKKYIFEEAAPSGAWDRIELKLNEDSLKSKLGRYKMLTIAAVGLTAVCTVFIFSHLLNHPNNPDLFSSNGNYKSIVMEELYTDGAQIYDLEQIISLKNAYTGIKPLSKEIKTNSNL